MLNFSPLLAPRSASRTVRETRGFTIFEGSIADLHIFNTMWLPFVRFEVNQIMTIDEVNMAAEALPE